MASRNKILGVFIACCLVLSACGQGTSTSGSEDGEKADTESQGEANKDKEVAKDQNDTKKQEKSEEKESAADSYKKAVNELAKAKEGQDVNYEEIMSIYKDKLQALVQKRDSEKSSSIDQHITIALQAGKSGELSGAVVKQIFDKLMLKVFFNTVRHEFAEIGEAWGDKEEGMEELEEAEEFYAILKPTVEKRENAYSISLTDKIRGGFDEIEGAIQEGNQLEFQLGKQVVGKTLMKTFYLAAGGLPHGYATKAAEKAKEDVEDAKVQQAEGWAFFQSINGYISGSAKEEAAFIEEQFNLENDVKELDPKAVNQAFVRGFLKVALHEYEESLENWGKDKSVITALEGALFVDMIGSDIKRILGEEAYAALSEQTNLYLQAVKANEKEQAESILKKINTALNNVITKAK